MENFKALSAFPDHLQKYLLEHPEELPTEVNMTNFKVKPFQNAWTDIRLSADYEYTRYMDVVFIDGEKYPNKLHSYLVTYSSSKNIINLKRIILS
ncbi:MULTISPECIES: hypothetical protein [Olivibacter]|jgi:hypothetical protein|uniref:Uncharacterized protein n=3 Tax=Sphingobacteriaceae TaxID=84566 RepID=F4C5Y5_SPHS2|nr:MULTISPECIES: hypothetical protein [Olivibacter]MDM8175520.1 hypothetical protein [Olivibacter sp. 47]MDX3914129.1 hypothetical protein [Pseudosphingobacterium sp.]QEL02271.1 hypothetical protein FKG96_16120 [Olivibacter sp. LS-1]